MRSIILIFAVRHDDDAFVYLILFGVIACIAVLWFVVSHFRQKKRTEDLQRIAEELGLLFNHQGGDELIDTMGWSDLCSRGRAKKAINLMRGSYGGREVAVFDYQFVTGHGKSKHTWNVTVACLRFDGQKLPGFSLRPEAPLDKIKAWFGGADIDFETRPDFSRRFLLRGESEHAVRSLFTDAVLEFYERRPGISTEGLDHTLLFYRWGKKVAATDMKQFLADAFEAMARLRSQVDSASSS